MTILEISLAAVLITENLAILLVSMWDHDDGFERDDFGDDIEEAMGRKI
ncbi:hypothetical protein [Rhodococcus zopfii]|nr:hypothetical protein [Rhodococcus zopfii]